MIRDVQLVLANFAFGCTSRADGVLAGELNYTGADVDPADQAFRLLAAQTFATGPWSG
ncbi:hypothetical protein AB0P23_14245 [Rhodococcus sp. NPDC077669]|uniref:hypothetical protein n=1 Tax=Rhodococcus sp. NPDC077669 TaxID=3155174 RepID=UPI0034411FB4